MKLKTYQFVTELEKLGNDARKRGDMAVLRRGLMSSDGDDPIMFQVIYRLIHAARSNNPQEVFLYDKGFYFPRVCRLAALFTIHPSARGQYNPEHNFGHHLKAAAGERMDSTEKRFKTLLSVDEEDLFQHLKHTISLISSVKPRIFINYHALFHGMCNWGSDELWVQKQWAQGFWGFTAFKNSEKKELTNQNSVLSEEKK